MNEKWFALDIKQIEKKLKTNAASGLSRQAARSRENKNNGQLFHVPKKSFLRNIWGFLSDFSLIILLLGAIFSLFFENEERMRGIAILVIVVSSLAISISLYLRSQKTVDGFASFFYPSVKVIRGGKLHRIDFRRVVIGDVIIDVISNNISPIFLTVLL